MSNAYEVWLLDLSGSMIGQRIQDLRAASRRFEKEGSRPTLIGFATELIPIEDLDHLDRIEPNGGTALHLALRKAAELMAGKVMVFTDGCPNDATMCFAAATHIPGIIDCVFCGDKDDRSAIEFCEKLSRDNGGLSVTRDVRNGQSILCNEVRSLLGLPAPISL
jgi:hypothetical protein